MNAVVIFGVRIIDYDVEHALLHLESLLDSGRPHAVYFANAHTLNLAAASEDYRRVLNRADAVFGDGTGVRWAAGVRGIKLAANLCGTDLVPALVQRREGLRCFILGSAPDRMGKIANNFRRLFPMCHLVGARHGHLDEAGSRAALSEINRAKPDLLLVGMGNPLQEQWIERYRDELDVRLSMGVGGLLEYWAGTLDRAPGVMRRWGIEWVHILLRQPWKARRYLIGNVQFLGRTLLWLGADRRLDGAATK